MREYELIIVLTPTLTQEEVSGIHERVKGLITERGGDISFEDMWGMRRLAYPLRKAGAKFLEGNYILSRFNLDGQHTKDVEGYLRLSENVLRYLLVKAEGPLPIPRLVEQRQSIDGDKREPEEVEASKEEGQTSVALIEEPPKEVEAPVEEDSTPAASLEEPPEEVETPAEEDSAPAASLEEPSEEVETPAEEDSAPAASLEEPSEEVETPAEEDSAPAASLEEPPEETEPDNEEGQTSTDEKSRE